MPTTNPSAFAKLNPMVHRWMLQQPATASLFCALSRKYQAELPHPQLEISGFSPPCFSYGKNTTPQQLKKTILLWIQAKKHGFVNESVFLRFNYPWKKISAEKKEKLTDKVVLRLRCSPAEAAWQERYLNRALKQWLQELTETERRNFWGDVAEEISLSLYPEQTDVMPWQRILRKPWQSHQRSHPVARRSRLSKRYGTPPGLRLRSLQHLAIAIDTSGSVSEKELGIFQREINALRRYGHRITLIQFDDRIRQILELRGPAPTLWHGRGNTAYDPVLRWVNRHRIDVLFIFTDGRGPLPLEKSKVPVWWINPPQIAHSFKQLQALKSP